MALHILFYLKILFSEEGIAYSSLHRAVISEIYLPMHFVYILLVGNLRRCGERRTRERALLRRAPALLNKNDFSRTISVRFLIARKSSLYR